MVEAFERSLELQPLETRPTNDERDKVRLGNIMARVRMVALFDQAKQLTALVLGTENKTELYFDQICPILES